MENTESLDPYTPDRQISQDHLVNVCKYRQGEDCCRYIFFPRDKREFYCTKKIEKMKDHVDSQIEDMIAKSDNCEGLPNETR